MESSVDRVMNWTAGVGSRPNCWAKRLVVPATGVAERSTSAQYRPGESRSGSSASSVRTGTRMSFRKQARYSRACRKVAARSAQASCPPMTTMARGVFRSLRKETALPNTAGRRTLPRKRSRLPARHKPPGLPAAFYTEKAGFPPIPNTPRVQSVRLKAARDNAP